MQSLMSSSEAGLYLLLLEFVQERTESSGSGHLPRRGNMRSRIPSWSCMATAGERPSPALLPHCPLQIAAAATVAVDRLWSAMGQSSPVHSYSHNRITMCFCSHATAR